MTETRKQIDILTKPYWAEWQTEWDITAVIKFIESKWWSISLYEWTIQIICMNVSIWYLELNPLSLYTDQQDKDLLTILQQLQASIVF